MSPSQEQPLLECALTSAFRSYNRGLTSTIHEMQSVNAIMDSVCMVPFLRRRCLSPKPFSPYLTMAQIIPIFTCLSTVFLTLICFVKNMRRVRLWPKSNKYHQICPRHISSSWQVIARGSVYLCITTECSTKTSRLVKTRYIYVFYTRHQI